MEETTLSFKQGSTCCSICDDYVETYYLAVRGTKKRKVCEDCRPRLLKMKPSGTYMSKEGQGLFCQRYMKPGKTFVAIGPTREIVSSYYCDGDLRDWLSEHEW